MKVNLPAGTYSLVFDATINTGPMARINIDNITVIEGNCTEPDGMSILVCPYSLKTMITPLQFVCWRHNGRADPGTSAE